MKTSLLTLLALITALFALPAIQAQENTAPAPIGYYIAADANGVQQVYQHLLDGKSEARQTTHATRDVLTFGVAYDGLSIAYISDSRLWLQPLHTDEAEAIALIRSFETVSAPVYSPDGQYIAYAGHGIWLLDLGTREIRQILGNSELSDGLVSTDYMRVYSPKMFVMDAEGKASKLIVDVGVWEWKTAGVYDLASGTLQELAYADHVHTSLLPLADGRVLLYGNDAVAGDFALHMADSLNDINTYTKVLDFSALTDDILWANQAIEIAPGIVRVFGFTVNAKQTDASVFYFDYDVAAGKADEVQFVTLTKDMTQALLTGRLSPDGRLLPLYFNPSYDEAGSPSGTLHLFDLATRETLAADSPGIVSHFSWQG